MSKGRDSTERFGALVEDYDRYRPDYPDAVFDFLEREVPPAVAPLVADLGAGTGISTQPLLERGWQVYAVEPNAPMRQAAERKLGHHAGFRSVDGGAERTGMPDASVDWILTAQAFHWFDKPTAQREFIRILRPQGRVAILFNERLVDATPFLRGYEDCLIKHSIDYTQVNHANLKTEVFDRFFAQYDLHKFENTQVLDLDGVLGRVRSCSYVPHPGDPAWPALEAEMTALFEHHQCDGRVNLMHETQLYWGTLPKF